MQPAPLLHRRHAVELIQLGVEAGFAQGCRSAAVYLRRDGQGSGRAIRLDWRIGRQLPGHGHQQQRVHHLLVGGLPGIAFFGRQGLAAFGNGRLASGRIGRRPGLACRLIRLVPGLPGSGFVTLGSLGLTFFRIHPGEAGSLALAGFRRFFRGFCGRCFRLHFRPGLQKQIGGNGHGHSPLELVRAGRSARDGPTF